jgi:SAM-dependent methyltransferase
MSRKPVLVVAALVFFGVALSAQDSPQQGRIKKVDAAKGVITLTVGDKDQDVQVTEQTRLPDLPGATVQERLSNKALTEGTRVMFKVVMRDGQAVLLGLRLQPAANRPAPARVDTGRLKPLTEPGTERYQEFSGGLYPDRQNRRPAAHEAAGLALAEKVRPLDADGKPDPAGKIVLLSVGMSNTTQEFSAFQRLANSDKEKNPQLVLVDGAQGGMTAAAIRNPDDNGRGTKYWATVDQRLKAAGVTRAQVQAAWIKEADAGPTQGFPRYAQTLQAELAQIVRLMHDRFPNLKLAYLSSRIYGGYARTPLNPEPYAYESAFSVKWLIEQQLKGDPELNYDPNRGPVRAPWLSWGPYLWANGMTRRADGLTYAETDFADDGTHPSQAGRRKVAEQLLQFFKADPTARPWFVQEKSVRPGINDPFKDPDLPKYIGVFEGESREVFAKRKEIVAACQLKPGMVVADIGAGTGLFTRLFAPAVGPTGKVYAVDIARKFIDHIAKTCKEAGIQNVTGVVCTPTSVELPPASCDLAFICDTYHHFEFPGRTLATIHRALRPGGRLVLVDFRRIEGQSSEWVLGHVRAGQEVFTREIVAAGFRVVDEPAFLKENYCVRFERVELAEKGSTR